MAIQLADNALDAPQAALVALAPMAGITDLPFRRLAAGFGASLVVSEMVASREMVQARPEARARAELGLGEAATAVQLAGREPEWMAEAARMVEAMGARVIDINMGCPAKKVTNGLSGSALLRDLPLALRLIEAVVGAVKVPVTLKTRLGWDGDCLNAPELARSAEAAGVSMITIHGRTRQQFYTGQADWAAIAAVAQAVQVPVLANGDIVDLASARSALRTSGGAGVMVGRGARGKPWLPGQIAAGLGGRPMPAEPRGPALSVFVAEHYEAILMFYGRDLGLRMARKHLGWYMDHAGTAAPVRQAILTSTDPAAVFERLEEAFMGEALAA